MAPGGARAVRARLAGQLDTLERLGFPASDELLDSYAESLRPVVELEVSRIPSDDRSLAVERVVIGTLLYEPVIGSIRRMLGEVVSAARTGRVRARPEYADAGSWPASGSTGAMSTLIAALVRNVVMRELLSTVYYEASRPVPR